MPSLCPIAAILCSHSPKNSGQEHFTNSGISPRYSIRKTGVPCPNSYVLEILWLLFSWKKCQGRKTWRTTNKRRTSRHRQAGEYRQAGDRFQCHHAVRRLQFQPDPKEYVPKNMASKQGHEGRENLRTPTHISIRQTITLGHPINGVNLCHNGLQAKHES